MPTKRSIHDCADREQKTPLPAGLRPL